mmetsp:Transcript_40357/g.80825  ORF Transcript_40357/g.80825 Transcript_40357/m.80825 type:complete len:133 (-) Transcript_40357:21-419(-)
MTQKNAMSAFLSSLGLNRPFRAKRNDPKKSTSQLQQSDRRKTIERGDDVPRLSHGFTQSPANQTLKSVLSKTPTTGDMSPALIRSKSSQSRSERRERKYDDGSISLSDLAFSMEWEEETVRFEGWTSVIEDQ